MPAAPEPGEFAATAQVPAAALALEVGAAPRPGRGGLPRDLVSAALALRPSPSVPPPANPGQPAAPRLTWTGPRQRRRAPALRRLAGPASLAALGGLPCAPSCPTPAEWTPTTAARTFAGTGGCPERRVTLAPGRGWGLPRPGAPAHPAARPQCRVSGVPRSSHAPGVLALWDGRDGGRAGKCCIPRLRAQPAK